MWQRQGDRVAGSDQVCLWWTVLLRANITAWKRLWLSGCRGGSPPSPSSLWVSVWGCECGLNKLSDTVNAENIKEPGKEAQKLIESTNWMEHLRGSCIISISIGSRCAFSVFTLLNRSAAINESCVCLKWGQVVHIVRVWSRPLHVFHPTDISRSDSCHICAECRARSSHGPKLRQKLPLSVKSRAPCKEPLHNYPGVSMQNEM